MQEKYLKILKKNGLKVTPKREMIIDFFLKKSIYATPEQIWEKLKHNFKKLGLPTIYRNLEQFNEMGILTRIEGEENRFYYALCEAKNPHSHHHHIVCMDCHKTGVIESCNFNQSIAKIEKKSGFRVMTHTLQIKGICEKCQKKH